MADYTITLHPQNESFRIKDNELILDAAIRQGVKVAYSCRNGTCRTCLHQVKSGTVIQEDTELCMISAEELANQRRLICMAVSRSDAVLEQISRRKNWTIIDGHQQ